MTMQEFYDETENICKFYGRELNEYERNIWYEELKTLNINRYKKIIRHCFRSEKYMPKLADILRIKSELPLNEEWIAVDCEYCKGEGIIPYNQFVEDYGHDIVFCARCTCANGRRLSSDIPFITQIFPEEAIR